VKNNVRDTELDIDYDHKMNSGEAAGWVKQAEFRENDGLYLFVEWTKSAAAKIKEKAYKYFSPEFAEAWKHPKSGAIYKDVLFGGGITNRPFLKDILPLNLSELIKESGEQVVINQFITKSQPAHQGGGKKMAAKKFSELSLSEVQGLAKTLGLDEDAPVSTVEKALNDLVGTPQVVTPPEVPSTPEEIQKKLSDGHLDEGLMADISALVADNPANKVLAEVIERQQMEIVQTGKALRFAEAQGRITKLGEMAIQKKLAFPAAVQDELRELLIDSPREFGDRVYDLMAKLATTGMVKLGELGRTYRSGDFGTTANGTIDERAKQLLARNPSMKYADAVEAVTRDDRRLFDSYRSDVMELD
jgi:phage I-like protein